jgi:hypothetical protein
MSLCKGLIIERFILNNALALWLFAFMLPLELAGDIQSTTQTMAAGVAANGKLSVPGSVTLRSSDTRFGTITGSVTVSYWARTTAGGAGSVTVQANADFTPPGGPAIGAVSYTCGGATLGAGCSGYQLITTSMQTPVVSLPGSACTGGGGVCSTQDPNGVLLTFSAPNKPQYKTGTYSAQITFTISAM